MKAPYYFVILVLAHVSRIVQALNLSFPGGAGLSYQEGVLRIKLPGGGSGTDTATSLEIPPPATPSLAAIEVKDTGTTKGYGAFATSPLARGTFLGFYEGEVIKSRETLDRLARQRQEEMSMDQKKPAKRPTKSAAMDYVMSLDGGVTFLDGYERAMDRSTFSPVHLNHADKGTSACNCIRLLERQHDRNDVNFCVAFFTSRNVDANEELCFDYGDNFWKGREHLKV